MQNARCSIRFARGIFSAARLWAALAALTALTWPSPAAAQQAGRESVKLEADRTRVVVGESFTVSLSLENVSRSDGANLTTPDFGELRPLGAPSQQEWTQIVNGSVSVGIKYTWQVTAPREGEFAIGPSQLTVGGRTSRSNSLTITVTANDSTALPPSLQGAAVLSARSRNTDVNRALDGRLFLLPELSTTTPYVSQPVYVTYRLLRDPRLNVTNFTEQIPQYQGVLTEELFHSTSLPWRRTEIDGETFDAVTMLRQAIVPTRPGDLSLDGYAMGCRLVLPRQSRRSANDPFRLMDEMLNDPFSGDPFFNTGVPLQLPTPPIDLKVRPLPEVGKPALFAGTVGEFAIAAQVDRTQASADDLLRLTVTLEGRGPIELAAPPTLPGDAFEVVNTESKVEVANTADEIGGSKQFELVLRPLRSGQLTLPAIEYPIFNPWNERYETLRTEPIAMSIAPGSRPTRPPVAALPGDPGFDAGFGAAIGDDLYPLKPIAEARVDAQAALFAHPMVWLSLLAALAFCVGGWWRRRTLLRRDPARHRRQGAWRRFERRVRALQQGGGDGGARGLAGRLEAAARDCIADHFNLSAEGLTRQEIERLLHRRAMPAERVTRICDLLDQCAAMRYAQATPDSDPRQVTSQLGEEMMRLLKEGFAS
jgi:hypothetical protein